MRLRRAGSEDLPPQPPDEAPLVADPKRAKAQLADFVGRVRDEPRGGRPPAASRRRPLSRPPPRPRRSLALPLAARRQRPGPPRGLAFTAPEETHRAIVESQAGLFRELRSGAIDARRCGARVPAQPQRPCAPRRARRYRRRLEHRGGHAGSRPTSPTPRCAAASTSSSPRWRDLGRIDLQDPDDRARAPASPCWRSASTGQASSTIRATSTSSSSSIRRPRRCARASEAATVYTRIAQQLARLLQERTADGYVHRVDYRLRPDPGSTPTAVSLPSAYTYYETVGQNWERAALIKARPVAGDIALGETFPGRAAPLHLAQVFRLRLHRRRARHEAADPRGARARRDRGRRPRHQARTRRHPRDRVLRADAAARLRRAPPGLARPAHPRHAGGAPRRGLDHRARRATSSPRPTASCAPSSTACRWWPTSRRSACRRTRSS